MMALFWAYIFCTLYLFNLLTFFGWGGDLFSFSFSDSDSWDSWVYTSVASESVDSSASLASNWFFSSHLLCHSSLWVGVGSGGCGQEDLGRSCLNCIFGGPFLEIVVSQNTLFPRYTRVICTADRLGITLGRL